MTQFMAYRGFSLRRADASSKVLITAFLVAVAGAIAVGMVDYGLRTGATPAGTIAWYRGDGAALEPLYGKTALELLDATHAHLFGQAFLFFVLCHLFALTRVRAARKLVAYVASFAGVLVGAAAPWLIRYVGPEFAALQIAGTVLMAGMFTSMAVVLLFELWFG